MSNVIALIWDFDKTLVDGYMQDPIFKYYNINSVDFWKEVNELPKKYQEEQGVQVNKETIYLNHFIRYAKEEKFKGLNNNMLQDFGQQLKFYPGVTEIFKEIKKITGEKPEYNEYSIKIEHYIVSTGMKAVIMGSPIIQDIEYVWGCELMEENGIIGEIGYTIDNTSKTRAIFEINKGIPQNSDIDVNSRMEEENRRVSFENMIYIADGPSDVPAFSLINKHGGETFAVYPKKDSAAFRQVEQLRCDQRIHMYAEADYSKDTTAYMWLTNKVRDFADRICKREREKIMNSVSAAPRHL